ncbi:MAG: GAF domain-containing protein [Candidatus Sericytochromatia bacterium]
MQNPNLPPGAQPVQGQPPPKLTREQKRALAEQKKRMEQERMRAMEMQKLVGNLQLELEQSVIDPPMMYKLAANRLKLMLKADHAAVAVFETYEQIGEICVIRQQSNLPPKPVTEKKEEDKPKVKRVIVDGEVIETIEKVDKKEDDDAPKIPLPKQPPKEPLKGGQLPDLEGVFLNHLALIDTIRQTRQPLMIPDASKFSDQAVVQLAQPWGIKSLLFLPSVVHDQVEAIMIIMTTHNPQGYTNAEMQYVQRALEILARSIETAPPILPEKLKERVITPMTHGDNVDKQIEYYSEYFDDIFNFMIAELDEEDAAPLIQLQEELSTSNNRLRKVWYQIGKFLEFKDEPDLAYLFNIGMNELAIQAVEYANGKKLNKPRGLVPFQEFMDRRVRRPDLTDLLVDETIKTDKKQQHIIVGSEIMSVASEEAEVEDLFEEILEEIDTEITRAVRGALLFNENKRATLINDIEQSEMLINFVSVTAAQDFKQHIQTNLPEMHEDVDKHALVAELAHQGMREISLTVAQNLAEKHLYEIESFLEKPEEWQRERIERLKLYSHYRIMANLVPTLRSEQTSLWGLLIADRLKKKAQKAAKQRAVLVGRMVRAASTEDDDWDDDEEEDED